MDDSQTFTPKLEVQPTETLDMSTHCVGTEPGIDDDGCMSPESDEYFSDVEETDVTCQPMFTVYHDTFDNSADGAESSADGNIDAEIAGIYSAAGLYNGTAISPKRMCLVCSDTASGLHYGVASCEACKAFFKRTVQGNIEYTCPAFGNCEITKRRRKACQACRFQKCLAVGMLKEGVRLDRVRGGRQKYRRSGEYLPTITSTYSLLAADFADIKMLPALLSIEPEKVYALPDHSLADDDFKLMATLSDLADRELVATIGWAKQVPGFLSLPLPDQMNLLQSTWLDIICFNEAFRSVPYEGCIVFADDFKCSEAESTKFGIPSTLDSVSRKLAQKMTKMMVTTEEYILLKTILLLNPDINLRHSELVQQLRDHVQDTLLDHLINLGTGPTLANRRICDLLLLMPLLTHKKILAKEFWLGVKHGGRVTLHKLLSEMLEFLSA